jgi:hypothetical protein
VVANPRPTPSDHEKSSLNTGSDSITYIDGTIDKYYIGVSAWTNTSFTILAHATCSSAVIHDRALSHISCNLFSTLLDVDRLHTSISLMVIQ